MTSKEEVIKDCMSALDGLRDGDENAIDGVMWDNCVSQCQRVMRPILERFADAQQSEIDRLMLEFCPEEMTKEQKRRWAESQIVAPHSEAGKK